MASVQTAKTMQRRLTEELEKLKNVDNSYSHRWAEVLADDAIKTSPSNAAWLQLHAPILERIDSRLSTVQIYYDQLFYGISDMLESAPYLSLAIPNT